jgi:hypothetical protein
MKRLYFTLLLMVLVLVNAAAQQAATAAELTFVFTRQSGHATNQFAVWIEDAQGRYIKTLYAASFTAHGGWSRRPTSIPIWVKQSGAANLTKTQVDAISGATPKTGTLTYTWDGTDSRGVSVPNGNYTLFLEGTLRWENQVLYRVPMVLGQGASIANVNVEYTGDSASERSMIENVRVRVLR